MSTAIEADIVYPESDGKPMADNTLQWEWMVAIKGNIDGMYIDRDDVFVASDLFWYPVKGKPKIVRAPDAMVAFGRPRGYRGSYRQWHEGDIAPQVVFEILSPNNAASDVDDMVDFYDEHNVEEFYLYDPQRQTLRGWLRVDGTLTRIAQMNGWESPLLKIRFQMTDDLTIYRPDGERFLTLDEIERERQQFRRQSKKEHRRAERETARAEREKARAEQEKARAEQEKARAEDVAAQNQLLRDYLRRQGLDPDNLGG